ncbi:MULTISPECIES: hypothetical protein [unclassified Beijerinckia]|uniref:hypothetical protein n=1 Tax=unclassified Beijerinckia TaxID=2638183 RepID=UPI000898CC51|nr:MULTISPECIES: hypothetical protein [unclassified Beijerinckia]MDH7794638.1 hypothetical protein [Beijerinckia sp. GAS462]SEB69468.1 hypothetical protein SAMN05443249_0912 [Beijerinckia sp. 28-YEA-48]
MITRPARQARSIATLRVIRRDDPDKALVLSMIERLVRRGFAKRRALDNGDFEVRFHSGEVFLLGDADVTRIR